MFKKTRKILLWTASLLITLIVFACLIAGAMGLWLGTTNGQGWMKQQAQAALNASPYRIDYGRVLIANGLGLWIDHLTLSDKDGVFLTVRNADIGLNPGLLAAHIISARVTADMIDVQRLPVSESASTESPPFDPSSQWMRAIRLRVAIKQINLAPAISGEALSLKPDIDARVTFRKDGLPFTVKGRVEPIGTSTVARYLPMDLSTEGTLNAALDFIELKTLTVDHQNYVLKADGAVGWDKNGVCNASATLDIKSLAALFGSQDGRLHIVASCAGATMQPALNATGTLAFASAGDISPIDFGLKTTPSSSGIAGNATISGSYRQQAFTLAAPFTFADDTLTLPQLNGTLPEAAVTGNVRFNTQNNHGDGTVKATIRSLAPYGHMLNLPLTGQADLIVTADAKDAQSANARLDVRQIRFRDIALNAGTLIAESSDIRARPFDRATVDVQGLSTQGLTVKTARATIAPQPGMLYDLIATGNGQYAGNAASLSARGQIRFDSRFNFAGATASPLTLTVQSHDLTVNGAFTPEKADLRLSAKNVPLSLFVPGNPAAMRAAASMTATIDGPSAAPRIAASFSVVRTDRKPDLPDFRIDGSGIYADHSLSAKIAGKGTGIKAMSGQAATPMRLSLWPFAFDMPRDGALKGDATADLSIASLAKFVLPPDMQISGALKATANVTGTLQKPVMAGRFLLSDGAFVQPAGGIVLKAVTMDAALQDRRIVVNTLSARDTAQGAISGKGWIEPFGDQARADLTLTMRDFQIVKNDTADAVASADLNIAPDKTGFVARGKIDVEHANVNIPERFGSQIPELNTVNKKDLKKKMAAKAPIPIRLDIALNALNRIFVRGWGLDAEFGGTAKINGTTAAPEIYGQFSSIRGRFQQLGKLFTIAKANLVFQGAMPPSPMLDISATTPAQDVTASINLTGPATQPKLTFSSNPALPEDEVLSRIMFGKDAKSISPLQAIQLANTLRQFSGKGGGTSFDPIGKIRSATGIDELNVDTGENGAVTVGAGKYVTDRVYIEAEQGNAEKSGAVKVQTEITPAISLESKIGQEQSGGGLFWKRDY